MCSEVQWRVQLSSSKLVYTYFGPGKGHGPRPVTKLNVAPCDLKKYAFCDKIYVQNISLCLSFGQLDKPPLTP